MAVAAARSRKSRSKRCDVGSKVWSTSTTVCPSSVKDCPSVHVKAVSVCFKRYSFLKDAAADAAMVDYILLEYYSY
jgi:hypothetical protein